jgi:hypothetical protein
MRYLKQAFLLGLLVSAAPLLSADDTVGKPPRGAVILFDGASTSAWKHGNGKLCEWKVVDGCLEVTPRKGGNLVTAERFGDFHIHLEFCVPSMPDKKGQSKGNSGLKLLGVFDIQILDSIDNPTYTAGGCGSIYRVRDPAKDVARPAGQWQTYDVDFRAPRLDTDGRVVEKPRISLVWNGVKVHDSVELDRPTSADAKPSTLPTTGPILLQDHSCLVRFRNIWIVPVKAKPRLETDKPGWIDP